MTQKIALFLTKANSYSSKSLPPPLSYSTQHGSLEAGRGKQPTSEAPDQTTLSITEFHEIMFELYYENLLSLLSNINNEIWDEKST